jgi:hypothetical protein
MLRIPGFHFRPPLTPDSQLSPSHPWALASSSGKLEEWLFRVLQPGAGGQGALPAGAGTRASTQPTSAKAEAASPGQHPSPGDPPGPTPCTTAGAPLPARLIRPRGPWGDSPGAGGGLRRPVSRVALVSLGRRLVAARGGAGEGGVRRSPRVGAGRPARDPRTKKPRGGAARQSARAAKFGSGARRLRVPPLGRRGGTSPSEVGSDPASDFQGGRLRRPFSWTS